jgi:starch synthase
MKGALTVSDYITTVSPNYAYELHHNYFAFGLAEVIDRIGAKMEGVINGIDYNYFSPERGGDIYEPYSLDNLKEGKLKNKLAFQKEVGLPQSAEVPLVVMITRLASQKGIDLVAGIIDELLLENIQFVILGTGDKKYEKILSDIACRYPDKARALIKFDRALSKRMYASADIFLMPSKSEPCGLAQMIACSYATVPVVRGVGGLYDTIVPYGEKNANGFVFYNFNAHEMLFRLKDALALYEDKSAWNTLRKNAMKTDFTWKKSAKEYIQIYAELCEQ